jgi:hypothetical protein
MGVAAGRDRSPKRPAIDWRFETNLDTKNLGLPPQDAVAYSLAIFLRPGYTSFLGPYNKHVRYSNPATPVADEDKSNAHDVINQQMRDLYVPEWWDKATSLRSEYTRLDLALESAKQGLENFLFHPPQRERFNQICAALRVTLDFKLDWLLVARISNLTPDDLLRFPNDKLNQLLREKILLQSDSEFSKFQPPEYFDSPSPLVNLNNFQVKSTVISPEGLRDAFITAFFEFALGSKS